MNRLILAGNARLKKDKVFWTIVIGYILLGGGLCISRYQDMVKYGNACELQDTLFQSSGVAGIVMAVFASMFIGTEYSDGTIRNKLIVGHKRTHIYLSGFFLCAAAGLTGTLCYLLSVCALGIPLFGGITLSAGAAVLLIADSLLLIIVYASVCNLIAMLIPNKAYTAIISLLLVLVLMLAGGTILKMLQAPEFLEPVSISLNGQNAGGQIPNPRYLVGAKREWMQFMIDLLPTGQGFQIAGASAEHPGLMALYSAVLIFLFNGIGMFCFRKKDLK